MLHNLAAAAPAKVVLRLVGRASGGTAADWVQTVIVHMAGGVVCSKASIGLLAFTQTHHDS